MPHWNTAPPHRIMRRGAWHLYLAPHPALRPYVAHYTITRPRSLPLPPGQSETLTLLPDISGCFVFALGPKPKSTFWGATTKAAQVTAGIAGEPERFFVEFLPGGAHALTGLSMAELTNHIFVLQEVLPAIGRQLEEEVNTWRDTGALLDVVDGILLRMLAQNEGYHAVAPLLRLINMGGATVQALASSAGYSQRHLNRLFSNALGVGVKGCSRVLRINRAVGRLVPGVSLTQLAHNSGYYDQAHFNHDFKAVCGVSPSGYLAAMSAFYKEDYKF